MRSECRTRNTQLNLFPHPITLSAKLAGSDQRAWKVGGSGRKSFSFFYTFRAISFSLSLSLDPMTDRVTSTELEKSVFPIWNGCWLDRGVHHSVCRSRDLAGSGKRPQTSKLGIQQTIRRWLIQTVKEGRKEEMTGRPTIVLYWMDIACCPTRAHECVYKFKENLSTLPQTTPKDYLRKFKSCFFHSKLYSPRDEFVLV